MVFIGEKKRSVVPFLVSLSYSLLSVSLLSESKSIISKGQTLKDGEFLTSEDEVFELGFFSIENSSTSRYLGIRYRSIQDKTIIWIANINDPISGTNGSLTLGEYGQFSLEDGNGKVVWITYPSDNHSNDTVAVLLPTGNFMICDRRSIDYLPKAYWQSFDEPTDTLLPGMRVKPLSSPVMLGAFSSWLSETDPSLGDFKMTVDPRGSPQIVIWENLRKRWRSGHWTGSTFTGYQARFMGDTFIDSQSYISYESQNSSDLSRFRLSWDGYLDQFRWNESENKWSLMQRQPANECDQYNYCGNFAVCSSNSEKRCSCIDGFRPRNAEEWNRGNRSAGCGRIGAFRCEKTNNSSGEKEDEFKLLKNMKLPDNADIVETAFSLEECKAKCLEICSCNAYAYVREIRCMSWSGELIDVQRFDKSGFDLWVRLGTSEIGGSNPSNKSAGGSRLSPQIIVIIVLACGVFAFALGLLLWKLKRKSKEDEIPLYDANLGKLYRFDHSGPADITTDSSQVNAPDLPMFNFKTVAAATDNFSEENRLGQGGFGPVYKGILPGGQKIAVKRLSKVSVQGFEEFKNEIILIAKLQHRNLVRLLGCCIQGEEKLLIYELMPYKSLDCFIFDPAMQSLLDWRKRFIIIEGIARGLLYLHRDSRLRIIHRDLKAANILLDEDMNPKISDFGMAKIFGGNESEANTNRVVGTFGYMSPEYVMEGIFSVKSDVYSFGVLLLEILSGRKNTSFRLSDQPNLIAYTWQVWSEGRAMELVDSSIRKSCSEEEVLKCIQVGILCVQDSALHRPTMQAVVSMLESNSSTLPLPKQPTFNVVRTSTNSEIQADALEMVSANDLTVTAVTGR